MAVKTITRTIEVSQYEVISAVNGKLTKIDTLELTKEPTTEYMEKYCVDHKIAPDNVMLKPVGKKENLYSMTEEMFLSMATKIVKQKKQDSEPKKPHSKEK